MDSSGKVPHFQSIVLHMTGHSIDSSVQIHHNVDGCNEDLCSDENYYCFQKSALREGFSLLMPKNKKKQNKLNWAIGGKHTNPLQILPMTRSDLIL